MKSQNIGFAGLLLFAALSGGCVERRMTVVTDPPAAMISINNEEIGPSPVDVPSSKFIWYGYYDIKAVRDGYEPTVVHKYIRPPWYERFPFDFFSESVVPWHIKDNHVVEIQLATPTVVPTEDLLRSANDLRGRGQSLGPPPAEHP